jgi:hypothetical protein
MTLGRSAAWVVLVAIVVSLAFAPPIKDRGDKSDAAPGAPPGGAAPVAKKKKLQLDQDLVTALYRVGLEADCLAVAGASADDTTAVVGAVKTWLAKNSTAISDADTRLMNAINSRDPLIRKVQSELGSKDDVTALVASVAEFGAATANQTTVLGSLFAAGTAGLSPNVAAILSTTRVNQTAWDLPLPYCLKDRSQEDWVALRDALDNERVSAKENESPDPDMQAYLSNVRADPVIATAQTNLNTNLGAIQTAWDAAAVQGG